VFCNSLLNMKSACAARAEAVCGESLPACGITTRIFSIFASPSARRIRNGRRRRDVSASEPVIGMTAMAGGLDLKRPGPNIGAAMQSRMRRRAPRRRRASPGRAGQSETIGFRELSLSHRDNDRFRAVAAAATAPPRVRSSRARSSLGRRACSVAGNQLDQLPPIVTERRSQLANAFEQTVVADMDVRPDRLHQLPLAEGSSGVGGNRVNIAKVCGRSLMASRRARAARFAPDPVQSQQNGAQCPSGNV